MTTHKPNALAADLDKLLKRASAAKAPVLKAAESTSAALDNLDDHTKPASTGEQAAAMEKEQRETYSAPSIDTGAETSQVGASVEASTDGAAAVATNGEEGAKDEAQLADSVKEADRGEEQPQNQIDGKGDATGSFKSATAIELRAKAAELRKAASATLTPVQRFLVKAARASSNPKVKTAAEAMPEDELAEASVGSLDEQITGGQLSDEDASAILQEMLASGALTEEELMEVAGEELGGGEAAPAGPAADPAADPAAGAAPEVVEGEEEVVVDGGAEGQPTEEMMMAAEADPAGDDYLGKVAAAYPQEFEAGYNFFAHAYAQLKKASDGEPAAAVGVVEAAPEVGLSASSPEEEAALKAVQAELGMSDEDLAGLQAAEVPQMDKTAALKVGYRTAILSKLAALKLTP